MSASPDPHTGHQHWGSPSVHQPYTSRAAWTAGTAISTVPAIWLNAWVDHPPGWAKFVVILPYLAIQVIAGYFDSVDHEIERRV